MLAGIPIYRHQPIFIQEKGHSGKIRRNDRPGKVELLALCDLAQQTNNSQLAQQATDKAVHIATGGAGKEIEHLHQAIRAIDREQTQYVERWEWMIDNLGLCVRYS